MTSGMLSRVLTGSLVLVMMSTLQANPRTEIRLTRQEGYGAVSSEVSIRPDSVCVIKYFDAMHRPGDTIGVFGYAVDKSLFSALWALLEKSNQGTELRPDSRVLTVAGTQAGKQREFILPLQPPVPPSAREFKNRTDSLASVARSHPLYGLTVGVKFLIAKGQSKAEVRLENPGFIEARIPKGSSVQLQFVRKPSSEGWPAGGPVWDSLSVIRIESDRKLPTGKKTIFNQTIAFGIKGEWYYRAFYHAKGNMVTDSTYIRGEACSALDSIVIK